MQVELLNDQGQAASKFDVSDAVFGRDYNESLIHQLVVAYQANARQGTRAQKGRDTVNHSTKKPFKQKGTGRARQGSVRMPQHRGGGIIHGPKPRDYSQRTPKKMIAQALLGALSDRARNGRIHVIDQFGIQDAPSTKAAASFLSQISTARNILVVLDRSDEVSYMSLRNLQNVHVIPVDQLNAYDVLHAEDLVFTAAALTSFVGSSVKSEEVSA